MYEKVNNIVDELRNEIIDVSKYIHDHPELQFKEFKSAQYLKDQLLSHGFTMSDDCSEYPTAFKACFNPNARAYKVAILAEYDALPEIDHACGHNLIAAVAYGTAIALSKIAEALDFEVIIIGTPAEEGGHGGKIKLIEAGVFDDIDYALMVHPSTENLVARGSRANARFQVEFKGRACHSSRPEKGVNALNAMVQFMNNLDNQRHIMPFKSTFNGIITHGGTADNVVPDYARCQYSVRVARDQDLEIVFNQLRQIIKGVEMITGTEARLKIVPGYAACQPNVPMAYRFRHHLEALGEKFCEPNPDGLFGSSDIGNVSVLMPTIHAYFNVQGEKKIMSHHKSFTEAVVSDFAHEQMIKTTKSLAKTILDIHMDSAFRGEILSYFRGES